MYKILKLNQQAVEVPQYRESISNDGYVRYGKDNLYPNYLISLINKSAQHNAILARKTTMIAGEGFDKNGLDVKALNFLKNIYNECTLDEIAYKIAYDIELFGSFCLNIIWSSDGNYISEINYVSPSKIRMDIEGQTFYYCSDWSKVRTVGYETFPKFSVTNKKQKSQIYYWSQYRPGNEVYGIPTYIAAAHWMDLDYDISLFHNQQVKNGFHPSMTINFSQGIPVREEMDEVVRTLKSQFAGAINSGEVIITFSDGQDRAPVITPIELNNSDERFILLKEQIRNEIFIAHEVTSPILFGVKVPGELGGKNELLEGLEIFQSVYINHKQKVIEDFFNRLGSINGLEQKLFLNKYKIDLEKITE